MAAFTVDPILGVPASYGDWCDEVKIKNMVKTVTRENRVGTTKLVATVNPTSEGSMKGGGVPTTAVGIGSTLVDSLTGGIFVVESKETTMKGGDGVGYNESDISWKHFPSAAQAAIAA